MDKINNNDYFKTKSNPYPKDNDNNIEPKIEENTNIN